MNNETPEFLSVPEVATLLDVRLRDVRTMIADKRLIAVRLDGPIVLPKDQFVTEEGEVKPLGSLRGTLTLLADAGYTDDEAYAWLYRVDDELGQTPMEALRHGGHRAVRRVIAGLAF